MYQDCRWIGELMLYILAKDLLWIGIGLVDWYRFDHGLALCFGLTCSPVSNTIVKLQ